MKFLRIVSLLLIIVFLGSIATPVHAQDYRFMIIEYKTMATINMDGTVDIDYTMTFVNDPDAHAIDIVDISLPNNEFDLSNISAEINGTAITRITNSDIVSPGISLYLEANEIPAGGKGIVHTNIKNVRSLITTAAQSESEPYASLIFSPNWFDSSYCDSDTFNYEFDLVLPVGVQKEEVRYQYSRNWSGTKYPEFLTMSNGRAYHSWTGMPASATTNYTFGASFPSRYITGEIVNKASNNFNLLGAPKKTSPLMIFGLLGGFILAAVLIVIVFITKGRTSNSTVDYNQINIPLKLYCRSCGNILSPDNVTMVGTTATVTCPYCHIRYHLSKSN